MNTREGSIMRIGWLILTVVLLLIATYMLANSIYWIVIGYSQTPEFIVGTFVIPILLYLVAYEYCWKRAKKPQVKLKQEYET